MALTLRAILLILSGLMIIFLWAGPACCSAEICLHTGDDSCSCDSCQHQDKGDKAGELPDPAHDHEAGSSCDSCSHDHSKENGHEHQDNLPAEGGQHGPGAHDHENCNTCTEYWLRPWRAEEYSMPLLKKRIVSLIIIILICYIYLKRIDIASLFKGKKTGIEPRE